MCLYPKLIINPKYKVTKKNGGNVPPIKDQRVKWVPIGCQDCMECRKQKARQWQIRLLEEIKTSTNGKFITFTFSNKSIIELKHDINQKLQGYDIDNAIATLAVRRFLERYRQAYRRPLRHWLVTELGQNNTEHLHIHGIIWTTQPLEEIEKAWKYGFIWKGKRSHRSDKHLVNYVNGQTCNYISKYVTKVDAKHPGYKSIILTSKGIGKNYTKKFDATLNRFQGKNTNELYRTSTGHQLAMPIYYRNKIYTDDQKEQLWLLRLDKMERWVCGTKVSVKKDEKDYFKLLKWYRQRNKELGYGGPERTWEQKQYETEIRNMKIKERLKCNTS